MTRRLLPLLLALAAVPAVAQPPIVSNHPPFRTVANLGTCTDTAPKTVIVTDGASTADCSTGSGITEVQCNCLDGSWVPQVAGTNASELSAGTIPAARVGADHIDAITEIAAALKSGADLTLVTGTAGVSGNCVEWNVDGDVVDSGGTCGGGAATWEGLTNSADTATAYTSDNTAETVTYDFQSAFTTGSQYTIKSSTGNPSGGTLFEVSGHDADVTAFKVTGTLGSTDIDGTGETLTVGTGIGKIYFGGTEVFIGDLTGNQLRMGGDSATQLNLSSSGVSLWSNGSAAAPFLNFQSDVNSGLFSIGADEWGLSAGGVEMIRLDEDVTDTGSLMAGGETVVTWDNDGTDHTVVITGDTTQVGNVLEIDTDGDLTAEITVAANGDTVFPQVNDNATPTLAFGDGDTGFLENADDNMRISVAGSSIARINANEIRGEPSASFSIRPEVSSATNPVYAFTNDTGLGLGRSASNVGSIIAGDESIITFGNDGTDHLVTIKGDTTQAGNVLEIDTDGDLTAEIYVNADGEIVDPAGSMSLVGTATTTDGTVTTIEAIPVASDSSVGFSCSVAARRTDADGESAYYKIEGMMDNNAGTTAIVGAVTQTVLAEDTAAWDATAAADDTADAIDINVTGEAAKTIQWTSRCETTEAAG